MSWLRLLRVLGGAALLAGCSSAKAMPECSSAEAYRGAARRDVPDVVWQRSFERPIDGVLDPAVQSRLDGALDSLLTRYPAISAAVAIPGQGSWTATRGVLSTRTRASVPNNALFQIASITKAFTAVIVLQLVEERRLRLATPVAEWFPNVPNARWITVQQLLEHTSGIVSFNALPDGRSLGPEYRSPDELIELATAYDPPFCPGAAWAYTNTGYVMLGRIIEAIEGETFAAVLSKRILEPLALEHTLLRMPNVAVPNVVGGHTDGVPTAETMSYALPFSAGALASAASDIVRFWHALLSGKLLSPKTVQASFTGMYPMQPLIPTAPHTTSYYGRGVELTDAPNGADGPGLLLNHDGGIAGFNAIVAYLVEDDAYVAVAVNEQNVAAAAGLWTLVRALRGDAASARTPSK